MYQVYICQLKGFLFFLAVLCVYDHECSYWSWIDTDFSKPVDYLMVHLCFCKSSDSGSIREQGVVSGSSKGCSGNNYDNKKTSKFT